MRKLLLPALFVMVLLISACSSEEGAKAGMNDRSHAEYIRPASLGGNTAAYFSYVNTLSVADTLLGVQAEFAGMAQAHNSYTTEDGLRGMKEEGRIVIQPNDTLTFFEGGRHVMFMDVQQSLERGDTVRIVLQLSRQKDYELMLPVEP